MQPALSQIDDDRVVSTVRGELKRYLAGNASFLAMPRAQQIDLYSDMFRRGVEQARAQAQGTVPRARGLEDPAEDPTTLDDIAGLAGDFLDEVDFPLFVRDLITGVYGSIVQSSMEQMDAYVNMFKELNKPLSAIARDDISSFDAMAEMAADDPLRFTMGGDGEVTDTNTGMKIDTSNAEVQQMMFEARLRLAKERRTMMMQATAAGLQRLVVTEGVIRAGLVFNVVGTEMSKSTKSDTDINQSGGGIGGGFFLLKGGYKDKKTKIKVSSTKINRNTELTAQITGFVEVKFTSDYFKLDHFAGIWGNAETQKELQEAAAANAPAAG